MVSMLSLTEDISLSHEGPFFLSQRTFLSLTEDISYSHRGTFYLSQKNTEEQNTQMPTETLSQPISQNLTATFNCNVLWILYAGGVLWVRNVGWNVLLNLWVLWEKKIPASLAIVLFLTDNTEEQNTLMPTETLSQPITQNITTKRGLTPSPSPNGEGSDHWGYPYMSSVCSAAISSYHQANRGNLTYYVLTCWGGCWGRCQLWKGGKTTSFHSLLRFYQEIYPYFLRRKKRTNRKFIGTQIANIGINAICLLSPNQRKSCRKVLCKT